MLVYRPSGMMCLCCANKDKDCSTLAFNQMHPIRKDKDGTIVVKCSEWRKVCT